MNIERYTFGDEAIPYIRSQLGMLTFSRFLRDLSLVDGSGLRYRPGTYFPATALKNV